MKTTDYKKLLPALVREQVKFIIVGGVAAIIHGSTRATFDLDIVYARDSENLKHLARAIMPYSPYPRGVPPGLPFIFDEKTLRAGLNFTLTTNLGDLDLLGEVTGGGKYEDLLPYTNEVESFGVQCLCLDLERLIQTKRAAGRPKDFEVLAELEAILEERRKS